MIRLFTEEECTTTARMGLTHSPSVFDEAREFYKYNETMRNDYIRVTNGKDNNTMYYLHWETNYGNFHPEMVYINEFWDYTMDDPGMDFELIERGSVFLIEEFNEYSLFIARMIRSYFPDKFIFFLDKKASLFFEESDCLHILSSYAEFYNKYKFFIRKTVIRINSDKEFYFDSKIMVEKRYSTNHIMTSIFWSANRIRFGDLHPDKTFYLIKNKLGMEGLVDMIKFALFRADMAKHKKGRLIPVVDQGGPGDANQFDDGSGENVWTMFFEQLTDIPIDEVYRSRNVILAQERQLYFNPYVLERFYFADWAELFRKYLRFNKPTMEFIRKLEDEITPENPGRILGVVGRGTDYNSSLVEGFLGTPLTGEMILEKTEGLVKEHGFDTVFLATEDAHVFDVFMNSSLKDKIYFVPQNRIDYTDENNNDKFLVDIYAQRERDSKFETLKYLTILYILSKCNALAATVSCGAYLFAEALNNHKYEFCIAYADTNQK